MSRHGAASVAGRLRRHLILLWVSFLPLAGCVLPASTPSSAETEGVSASLQFCADEINRYRSTVGRPPLTRSETLERFAADAARNDGLAGVAHLLFSLTNGGNGVAAAETALLQWRDYPVHDVIREGLARMWAVGPTGEHYAILAGAFTEVGCGVFVNATEVTVVQDYR